MAARLFAPVSSRSKSPAGSVVLGYAVQSGEGTGLARAAVIAVERQVKVLPRSSSDHRSWGYVFHQAGQAGLQGFKISGHGSFLPAGAAQHGLHVHHLAAEAVSLAQVIPHRGSTGGHAARPAVHHGWWRRPGRRYPARRGPPRALGRGAHTDGLIHQGPTGDHYLQQILQQPEEKF